jgi:hypothetical protein
MHTPENIANLKPFIDKEPPKSRHTLHLARLATFIERHRYPDGADRGRDENIIEVRRTDADIAFHLGISMSALEQCFAELIRQNVIRLRGAYQIEILSNGRLSELARQQS